MFFSKLIFAFFVQEVNKPSPHSLTVLEVKSYGFSDFTMPEGFGIDCLFKRSWDLDVACDLGHAPFWLIFHFFRLVSFTINLHAKFLVCILSRSRDISGVPKFEK